VPNSAILSIVKYLISLGAGGVLLFRVIIGLSQGRLFSTWVRLELNMVAFIALMAFSKAQNEGGAIKYFIIQGVGSRTFFFSLAISRFGPNKLVLSIIALRILLKLGAAPLHS
jgi:NADH:ubiquinone oxidoreductase subunit 2 (subunit N)